MCVIGGGVDPLYQIQKIVQRHLQLGLRSAKCLTLIYIFQTDED